MKIAFASLFIPTLLITSSALADAKIMNPGEAVGQFVYLSEEDVITQSEKYRSLSPLSIPVFGELPMDLAVISGAITLKQQNLLSHIQIKSRARGTPNLDISDLPGGIKSELLLPFHDGDYVHMTLKAEGSITLERSTEKAALIFYENRKKPEIKLTANLTEKRILRSEEISWRDFESVGSKAANYAELARTLNSATETFVRPGFAIPFYYYQSYITQNSLVGNAIEAILSDPLMNHVADVSYRAGKLEKLRAIMSDEKNTIDPTLTSELIQILGTRKTKLRSSTNSEDLPHFNGAGLYESYSYQPSKGKKNLEQALRKVWASVWTLRAYEERSHFGIPHGEVKMGMQVNPSFQGETANGVVVTKNIPARVELPGNAVYIEAQRGEKFNVVNPEGGAHPEEILVLYDAKDPLNQGSYQIHILQKSNVSDDGETVLSKDNPNPVMKDEQTRTLAAQSLRATEHFRDIFGKGKIDFALDLEFKIDAEDTGKSQLYFKQARPYVD